METRKNDDPICSVRYQITVAQLLVELGLAKDAHHARRFVDMRALIVGGKVITDSQKAVSPLDWSGQRVRFRGRDLECHAALPLIGVLPLR